MFIRSKIAFLLVFLLAQSSSSYLLFDGNTSNSDEVAISDSSARVFQINTFTVSIWAKGETQPVVAGSSWGLISSGSTGSGGTWSIFRAVSDDEIGGHFQAAGTGAVNIDSGVTITDGWHHIVYTNDGTNTRIYIDGVEKASGGSGTPVTGSWNVYIGSWGGESGRRFAGHIADARFYTRALSQQEITNLYASRASLNMTDGLLGHWKMDEGIDGTTANSNQTVYDHSGNGKHGTILNTPDWRAADWVSYQ